MPKRLLDHICQHVDANEPHIVEFRRELHRHPEVSGQEFATTERVANQLKRRGLTPRCSPSGRGLLVDLAEQDPASRAPGIALRADLDGLPIQDQKSTDYRSESSGVSHACGHDAHTAIALGATCALWELVQSGQLQPPGGLRVIFQPAEEICEGAQQMIQEGALQGIDAILAVHVDPSQTYGKVGYRTGVLTAICDELIIEIRGKGGHGARPHLSRDPIAAATQLIQTAYSQIPRALSPQWPHVISFCEIRSGHSANVIPDHALLRGTLRTIDRSSRDDAISRLNVICQTVAVQTGCEIRFRTGVHSPATVNHPELTQRYVEAARDIVPAEQVFEIPYPSMGGEDFAFYTAQCDGCMVRLGSRPPDVEQLDLHSPLFDIDEQVLALGAKLMAWTACRWITDHTS